MKLSLIVGLVLLMPQPLLAARNPVTRDTLRGNYLQIAVTFMPGEVNPREVLAPHFSHLHDELYFVLDEWPGDRQVISYNPDGTPGEIAGKNQRKSMTYLNGVLAGERVVYPDDPVPARIFSNRFDSLGLLRSSSVYERFRSSSPPPGMPAHYLKERTELEYEGGKLLRETWNLYMAGDSARSISSNCTTYIYSPAGLLEERRISYEGRPGETIYYQKNGDFRRDNYDREGKLRYYTQVRFRRGKMVYRVCRNADSTLQYENRYELNTRNEYTAIRSEYNNRDGGVQRYREERIFDRLQLERERRFYCNDSLLFTRTHTFNARRELAEVAYRTPDGRLMLRYTVSYDGG